MTKKIKKEVQIILNQSLPNGGQAGSLLTVRAGYARNYLIPKGIGNLATQTAKKEFVFKQKEIQKQENKLIESYLKQKEILENSGKFEIEKRVGEENKIFGRVTGKQIIETIEAKTGLTLKPIHIEMPEIKQVGLYEITFILYPKIEAKLNIEILSY